MKKEGSKDQGMKLTRKQLSVAVACYARRHGFYARTVRAVSSLRYDAIAEWRLRSPEVSSK